MFYIQIVLPLGMSKKKIKNIELELTYGDYNPIVSFEVEIIDTTNNEDGSVYDLFLRSFIVVTHDIMEREIMRNYVRQNESDILELINEELW